MLKYLNGGIPFEIPGTLRIDTASATTIYVGEAPVGAEESAESWQIKRIDMDVDGNVTAIKWALKQKFECAWNDRASYTYI